MSEFVKAGPCWASWTDGNGKPEGRELLGMSPAVEVPEAMLDGQTGLIRLWEAGILTLGEVGGAVPGWLETLSPANQCDVVQRALREQDIKPERARELLKMPDVEELETMAPGSMFNIQRSSKEMRLAGVRFTGQTGDGCEYEDPVYATEDDKVAFIADLTKQLTTATQRASALADEAGSLRARLDASEGNVVTANTKCADLESDLRVARRTIAALRGEISLLRRACR